MAIHVPLEIRVSGYNGEDFAREGPFSCSKASAGIINEQGQMLVKLDSSEGYSVFSGFPNENNGSNYYLAKRKKPKAGKLCFATDYEEEDEKFEKSARDVSNYVIFIDKQIYVFWKPIILPTEKTVFEIQHCRTWHFNNWKFFYEVKKRKSKK